MASDPQSLRTSDLLGVTWRSFFIQASWSFDRMQSLGFAFAMVPVLRRLYPDERERSARLTAQMEYFNTQPYFASFILGAAARREEDRATGRDPAADPADIKTALMAPLGALGDSFFWGAFRPFAGAVAAAGLLTGIWWVPLLYLILYNAVHVGLRGALVFAGYRTAGDAVALMGKYHFTILARLFKSLTLAVLGCLLGAVTRWGPQHAAVGTMTGMLLAAAALAAAAGLTMLLRGGATPVKLMIGLAMLCVGLALGGII